MLFASMLFIFISFFLLLPYIILLFYYRKSWKQIPEFKPAGEFHENELPVVSVIIAARNEEKNIGKCIESLIRQSYPKHKFEVIITNDHSTDKTIEIIHSMNTDNIRVLNLEDFIENRDLNSYKKKSIETALHFSKGELIITTDADCIVPQKWIETMVAFYKEKDRVFIAAPVLLTSSSWKKIGENLLAIFQNLDFMTLQGITGASVSRKFHSMCNGANLAYRKDVFYEVNGFEGIDEIASGDDMLLMHKIQEIYPDRIGFLKSPNVIVQTSPEKTLSGFFNQRIRWASKADKYTDKKITFVLLLVYLLNAWIFILGFSTLYFENVFYLFIVSISLKTIAELYFLLPVADFFKKRELLWWFIPAQPFHIIYTLIAGWLGKFGNYKWKGRKVK
jgi:cellulose synthase/poly-beta-1,6-N-acetylglucosamine synthase-like glycosyltransferase